MLPDAMEDIMRSETPLPSKLYGTRSSGPASSAEDMAKLDCAAPLSESRARHGGDSVVVSPERSGPCAGKAGIPTGLRLGRG